MMKVLALVETDISTMCMFMLAKGVGGGEHSAANEVKHIEDGAFIW